MANGPTTTLGLQSSVALGVVCHWGFDRPESALPAVLVVSECSREKFFRLMRFPCSCWGSDAVAPSTQTVEVQKNDDKRSRPTKMSGPRYHKSEILRAETIQTVQIDSVDEFSRDKVLGPLLIKGWYLLSESVSETSRIMVLAAGSQTMNKPVVLPRKASDKMLKFTVKLGDEDKLKEALETKGLEIQAVKTPRGLAAPGEEMVNVLVRPEVPIRPSTALGGKKGHSSVTGPRSYHQRVQAIKPRLLKPRKLQKTELGSPIEVNTVMDAEDLFDAYEDEALSIGDLTPSNSFYLGQRTPARAAHKHTFKWSPPSPASAAALPLSGTLEEALLSGDDGAPKISQSSERKPDEQSPARTDTEQAALASILGTSLLHKQNLNSTIAEANKPTKLQKPVPKARAKYGLPAFTPCKEPEPLPAF